MTRRILPVSLLALGIVVSASAQSPGRGNSSGSGNKVVQGVPKLGSRGVRETVASLMARQAITPPRANVVKNDDDERYPDRSGLPQAPRAISAASFPPVNSAPSRSAGPLTGTQGGTLSLGPADPAPLFANSTGFRGTTGAESPYEPPDTNGDVSPTTVFFHINGRIRTYDRSGAVGALNVDPNVFFNSVRPAGSNIFDPRVRYDRLTNRFILVAIDGGINNRIYVAVSDTGTITASSTFTFFTFQQGVSGRPNVFADYPTMGLDPNALYIGTNDFNSSDVYQGSSAYVVRKSSILGGGPIVVTGFPNVNTSTATSPGAVTPQGVDNDDPSTTTGYFIGTSSRALGELSLIRVNDPAGTPALDTRVAVPVLTTTSATSRVPQNGSATGLNPVGDRLFLAKICYDQNANRRTLWTSHNFRVTAAGLASSSGDRMGSRWYQIQGFAPGEIPSLVQAGTVIDPGASNVRGFIMPSVVQSLQGHALLGSTVSSAAMFGSATSSYRNAGDALGTMTIDLRAKDGTTVYPGNRWGDYSMATVDPVDGMSFWSFQEYAEGNDWAVWVQKILAPAPTITAGASARRGQSLVLGITGTGFFDPPATYPNHLAAVVGGIGVSLTSPTYVSPTLVNGTFTVGQNASLGSRTLTVINPDGQLASGAFTVLPILITGSVTFGDYPASTKPPVTVEFFNGSGNMVSTLTVTPNADGSISLEPDIAAANYTVRVRSAHFLRRAVTGVDASGGTASFSAALINGDANNDNSVTIADVNVVRAALGSSTGGATYNSNADLNGDGSVTIADVNIVRANLGKSGD